MGRRFRHLPAAVAAAALLLSGTAQAKGLDDTHDQWMPSPRDGTWTYGFSDDHYATTPTLERYTVATLAGAAFKLQWTTQNLGNPSDAMSSAGTVSYQRTLGGLVNTDWTGTTPPASFPILCARATQCGNSIASAHFLLIWGTRSPVIPEPLLRGTEWTTSGGSRDDVTSSNRYVGRQRVVVPAFPHGIVAAKIVSDVTQAGALGDPYGSGVRTTWWVRGVGPVLIRFVHTGGGTTWASLHSTNLKPVAPPSDRDYLPMRKGAKELFSYRNSRHMRTPSVQRVTVSDVVNNTARVDVTSVKGPIRLAASYVYATRLNGRTNLAGASKAASRATFPPLGPRSLPKSKRRHFFTPLDLMNYGFNPILPAYPRKGQGWRSDKGSRDFDVFGVTGRTRVLGLRTVRTKAGRFRALAVFSRLHQPGFRFGSGTRTSYFAPAKGLVKLVFRHADGSVSTVERLR